jgi:glycosyltransferase involved in cell wall biosynthesis
MPTIGRHQIFDAVRSVFAQKDVRSIQLLIGVDAPIGDFGDIIELLEGTPSHVTVCLFYPGYSTSVRHGGLHPSRDGGTLRATLTYLANARYVAYLDDDNWWDPTHLKKLLAAIDGRDWAFSHRWFVHPESKHVVCEDSWESVGPGKGIFLEKFGGWVDPNCLMLDKLACEPVIRWWGIPLPGDQKAMSADRHVYDFLQRKSAPGEVTEPTVFYTMQPQDVIHPQRLRVMGELYDKAGESTTPITQAIPPRLSLVTTCKGRLHHLKQTLPLMVAMPDVEVIVVDYGCPQGAAAWVRETHPKVKVIEVTDDPGFHLSRARNIGGREATAPWILFIDVDVLIDNTFSLWFREHARYGSYYLPEPLDLEAFGTVLCSKTSFDLVDGYDEAFRGWGGEDWDLYYRLRRAGLIQGSYPLNLVDPIRHEDAERYTFHTAKSKEHHHLVSQIYFYMKWDLEMIRKRFLALEERKDLMQRARELSAQFVQHGQVREAIGLGENLDATRFTAWKIERQIIYDLSRRLDANSGY